MSVGGSPNNLCSLHRRSRCFVIFDGSAIPANYLIIRQATLGVTTKPVAMAAGATDSCPPLDSNTILDTGCGPCARIVITDSGQDKAISAAKAVTVDAFSRTPEEGTSGLAPTFEPPSCSSLPPSPTQVGEASTGRGPRKTAT